MPIEKNYNYNIIKSRRKTLSLQVKETGIEVRSPYHVKKEDINQWVNNQSPWIEKKLSEIAKKSTERPEITHGGRCLLYGEYRDITTEPGNNAVLFSKDNIIIRHRKNSCPKKTLETALKKEATHYLTKRCMAIASSMRLTDKITGIQLRKTKSKWGHCTSHGKIQFNWLIIMAPTEVIDYLIIHELCHLEHMNHSRSFWLMVESYCPSFRIYKSWLHANGHKIWL